MNGESISERSLQAFAQWDSKSSVRTRKNRYSINEHDCDPLNNKNWFPPQMLPFLSHPHLEGQTQQAHRLLQAKYLVHFLDYTTLLEHTIVNRAVKLIIYELPFTSCVRSTGLKLYADEAYHALFSRQLADEVAAHFNMDRLPSTRIQSLNSLIRRSEKHKKLAYFLMGFVSETIISKELLIISRHALITPVYHMFCDHLQDEARHAQFFSDCFIWLWKTLDPIERAFSATFIPRLLQLFSRLDEPWLRHSLADGQMPATHIEDIVQHCKNSTTHSTAMATMTLAAVRQTDLLSTPAFAEQFIRQGVIQ